MAIAHTKDKRDWFNLAIISECDFDPPLPPLKRGENVYRARDKEEAIALTGCVAIACLPSEVQLKRSPLFKCLAGHLFQETVESVPID